MGIVKVELNVPDFEKELNISVTIKRDGEVIFSDPPTDVVVEKSVKKKKVEKKTPEVQNEQPKKPSGTIGGNMMNINI